MAKKKPGQSYAISGSTQSGYIWGTPNTGWPSMPTQWSSRSYTLPDELELPDLAFLPTPKGGEKTRKRALGVLKDLGPTGEETNISAWVGGKVPADLDDPAEAGKALAFFRVLNAFLRWSLDPNAETAAELEKYLAMADLSLAATEFR